MYIFKWRSPLCQSLSQAVTFCSSLTRLHRSHFGTIFRSLWGSKHSFHGNITQTHIDKRIGAAVFLWWRMKPQKLRGLQLENAIKCCQYILEEGSTRAEESVWFLIMRLITNDSYRLFFSNLKHPSALLCSAVPDSHPAGPLQCLSGAANGQQFPIRFHFTEWYIDLHAAALIKLERNNQAQFNLASVNIWRGEKTMNLGWFF